MIEQKIISLIKMEGEAMDDVPVRIRDRLQMTSTILIRISLLVCKFTQPTTFLLFDPPLSADIIYECPLSWSDQFHLFVAMGDRVRVCEIKARSAAELASPRGRDLPQHMVEITASFQVGGLSMRKN